MQRTVSYSQGRNHIVWCQKRRRKNQSAKLSNQSLRKKRRLQHTPHPLFLKALTALVYLHIHVHFAGITCTVSLYDLSCRRKRKPRKRRKEERENAHLQIAVIMQKEQNIPIHIQTRRRSTRNTSIRHTNELCLSDHEVLHSDV